MYKVSIDEVKEILEENGINIYIFLNRQLAVIYTPQSFSNSTLSKIREIVWWEEASPMSSFINITNNIDKGVDISTSSGVGQFNSPYLDLSGKGILIAILDSGINYLHPDFINNDGSSKIYSIWNQEIDNKSESNNELVFGMEFNKEDINQAIKEKNPSLCIDETGTGTTVAGIICGNGSVNSKYKGVAPGSELIVVKLRKYENAYHKDRINYLSSDFLAGISYILKKSRKLQKPVIINLTVGEESTSIYTLSTFNTFPEIYQAGVAIVSAAGNEGNAEIHYSGTFDKTIKGQNSELQDVVIQVGDDTNLEIVINSLGNDKISALVISPSGELSMVAEYVPDEIVYRGKFNIENTSYEIRYTLPWLLSGSLNINIKLKDVKPGIWTIRLMPEYIIDGNYNVYLPNKKLISSDTKFFDSDSSYTITTYGLLKDVITVGAYNEKTNSIWIGSSKGPHSGSKIKPDIVASGVDIISTYINNNYNTSTGTGVSASIVTGALALIMEYIITQTQLPQLSLYSEPLKSYLMIGADQKPIYTYPNISEGYGRLNFEKTINEISDNLM